MLWKGSSTSLGTLESLEEPGLSHLGPVGVLRHSSAYDGVPVNPGTVATAAFR